MLRWLTAGESHGPALMATLEGLPAGVEVTSADVAAALARRRLGFGRGARMKFEQDEVEFLGGLRHGVTIGSPLAIRIGNTEWPKWQTVMSPDPVDGRRARRRRRRGRAAGGAQPPLTRPRPGHADLVGMQKYGFDDARPVLERAQRPRDRRPRRARRRRVGLPGAGLRHPAGLAHRGDRHRRRGRRRRAPHAGRRGGAGRRPGAHARRSRLGGDGGRGRGGPQGRRHPRRCRRGAGLRPAARPGLARALGPAARRAARRRADGHPGDQGRRGRRRVPHRGPARLRGARRDGARRGRA